MGVFFQFTLENGSHVCLNLSHIVSIAEVPGVNDARPIRICVMMSDQHQFYVTESLSYIGQILAAGLKVATR